MLKKIINRRGTGLSLNLVDPDTGKPTSKMLLGTYHVRKGPKRTWFTHQGVLIIKEKEMTNQVALLAHNNHVTIEDLPEGA
jgi:hypothetical protein